MCTLGELEPKMPSQLAKTQDIHYKPKDLFDPEGGELPKLVESNMTNMPMGPKSL